MSEAHAAFRAECHIRLPGGVLVLAPPGAFGLGAVSVASVADGPGRLRLMAGHAEAFARLRADWVGLGLPGLPGRLSDTELLALLESAIASRRLAVAFFPPAGGPAGPARGRHHSPPASALRPPRLRLNRCATCPGPSGSRRR